MASSTNAKLRQVLQKKMHSCRAAKKAAANSSKCKQIDTATGPPCLQAAANYSTPLQNHACFGHLL
jgi:hypothetical protein